MRSIHALLAISAAVAIGIAACTTSGAASSGGPTQAADGTLVATSAPEATPLSAETPAGTDDLAAGGSPTPGPIDPCSLLTQEEASTAVGTTLGVGAASILERGRVCTWKAGSTEVKVILAPPAADPATAQAYWDAARQDLQSGINVNDVSGFDRAAYGSGGASGFTVSALFVIKGAQFFDFYCGLKACTEPASVTAANLIVARLP
jgi:hypothetical protein